VNGAAALTGVLSVTVRPTFHPTGASIYTVVSANVRNGTFLSVSLPPRFRVRYTPTTVELISCPADFNSSGAVTVQDIFDFLAAYFSGNPSADFNGSGVVSVQDIFDFLAAYFAGCP
jgi:hypothetical protein